MIVPYLGAFDSVAANLSVMVEPFDLLNATFGDNHAV
jgi:hypothetical protein